MKRMRYLAGAVALAPVAVALPVTAHAADAPASATYVKNVKKKVALNHLRANAYPATGGCGTTPFTIPTLKNVAAHGWYHHDFTEYCIGTVDVTLAFHKTLCKNAYLIIDSTQYASSSLCGNAGQNKTAAFDIQLIISVSGSVCASSTYATSLNCVRFG